MNKSKHFKLAVFEALQFFEELTKEWKEGGVKEQIEYPIPYKKNSKAILKEFVGNHSDLFY